MSLIKSIRHIGQKVGSVVRKAAPVLGLIPGVGTLAGAGLGALGSIAEGHRGLGGTLGSAALGGLSGLGGSKLRELLKAKQASAIAGGLAGRVPGDGKGAVNTGVWGKLGSITGGIGSALLPKNADGSINWGAALGNAAKYGLPALGAVQASKTQGKADKYRDKAIKLAEAEYAAKAPLRTMGLAGLTDPRLADVSSIFNQPRPEFRRLAL